MKINTANRLAQSFKLNLTKLPRVAKRIPRNGQGCVYCNGVTAKDILNLDTGRTLTEDSYCAECNRLIPA